MNDETFSYLVDKIKERFERCDRQDMQIVEGIGKLSDIIKDKLNEQYVYSQSLEKKIEEQNALIKDLQDSLSDMILVGNQSTQTESKDQK